MGTGVPGGLDRLSLRGMTFWGYTGVRAEEQERGQPFEVDLDLYLDLRRAAASDDLADTVDYSALFTLVRQVVEGRRFRLIEALAQEVAEVVLGSAAVQAVTVRVRKPQAPLPGVFETVEVELRRSRGGKTSAEGGRP
ncbi:MAG: dihydroneopterin aldolase [Betaproteobacteria bacterium]